MLLVVPVDDWAPRTQTLEESEEVTAFVGSDGIINGECTFPNPPPAGILRLNHPPIIPNYDRCLTEIDCC